MMHTSTVIQNLLEANPLREPVLGAVIQALQLPAGSRGLDVGCGIGLQAQLLAEAVGAQGKVTGLDYSPDYLTYGAALADRAGLTDRIAFGAADMHRLPFAANSFDWVWSADCAGYPSGELAPVLKEFLRVVRPGGSIILLAWTSQQVLPGYPLLEARLNAHCSSYLPFLKGKNPELHFLRAMHGFREAGLEAVTARTFAGDVQAPLGKDERTALTSLFEMLWSEPLAEASSEDWSEYKRLCKPASPDFILDQPGYYAFFTYTLFQGKAPRKY